MRRKEMRETNINGCNIGSYKKAMQSVGYGSS
nr:MAG TPA: hypothetical protein [Caudoviricetes sp.]